MGIDWGNAFKTFGSGIPFIGNMVNYDNQMELQNYQKELQEQIFKREDNAVQRRVTDLQKAGLSPVLAAGSAANAGAAINVSAPAGNTQALAEAYQLKQQHESIKQTQAQTALLEKQKEKIDPEINQINALKKKADSDTYLNAKIGNKVRSETGKINLETEKSDHDFAMAKSSGMSTNATGFAKTIQDISGSVSKLLGTHPSQQGSSNLNNQTKSALAGLSNNPLDPY